MAVITRWLPRSVARVSGSRLIKGTAVTFVILGSATGLRYGLQVFFARLGGVTQYGKYAYAMSLVQLVLIPAHLGFSYAVLKFVPTYLRTRDPQSLRGLLRRSLEIGVGASLGVAVVGSALVVVFDPVPSQKTSFVAGLFLIPLLAWSAIWRESVRGTEHVEVAFGTAELPPPIIAASVGLVMWRILPHITGAWMIVASLIAYAFTIGLQRVGVRRFIGMTWRRPEAVAGRPATYQRVTAAFHTRLWLSVSLPLMAYAALQVVMNNVDLFSVGLLKGPKAAGYYGAANKTAFLVTFLMMASTGIVAPMIARAYAGANEAEIRRLVRRSVQVLALPTLAVVGLVLALAPQIMTTFGRGFAGGVFPLRVLALGQLVNALTGPIGSLFTLTDGQTRIAKITATIAVLQTAALAVVVPRFGANGAAVVSTVAVSAWQGWLYVLVRRRFGIRLIGRLR